MKAKTSEIVQTLGFVSLSLLILHTSSCQGRRARSHRTDDLDEFEMESSLPRFAQPIPNVTVVIDRDATLPCEVENLRNFKVAWVRVDTQTILTIHKQVISRNPRISLSESDHRSWYLQIKGVQESDRGWYMCQVNTDPMRSLMGYLEVVVPPKIIDKDTSTDIVVKEGSNVTLTCKAKGHPEPYIMWRREDNQEILYNGQLVHVVDGDLFQIIKVSRLHMGAYLCIASNGIPPSISQRVEMKVQFPPMMTIPHQLEAAYVGQEVTVECQTEAYPKSINYWTDEKGNMLISGEKYESLLVDSSYRIYMRLKIRNISHTDFGVFKCVAKNSLGETDGHIKLYEIPAPSTTTIAVPKTTPTSTGKRHNKNSIHNVVIDYDWPNNGGQKNYHGPEKKKMAMPGVSSGGTSTIRILMKSGSNPSVTRSATHGFPERLMDSFPLALKALSNLKHILNSILGFCTNQSSHSYLLGWFYNVYSTANILCLLSILTYYFCYFY